MLTEKTRIILNNARFYAYHGLIPQERKVGAWYSLTLKVDYPFVRALETDDIVDTLSFCDVYDIVRREMALPSNLLEHVAGRILSSLFVTFPMIESAEVEIKKENPPIGGNTDGVSVVLKAKK